MTAPVAADPVEAPATSSLLACDCAGCRAGLDWQTAEHFALWAGELTLDTGALWVVEDFQLEVVADLFTGVRELWVVIPEGNAKTSLMAGVALHHGEHRADPWVPLGAASRDQAGIMHGQASGLVRRSRRLLSRFRVYDGYRRIACPTGGRGIQVYAADQKTGDGVMPTLAIVDELHRHDDLGLYRLWKGKLGKRDGQIIAISTAGEPGGQFEEMRERIRSRATDRQYSGAHLRAEGKSLVYHQWQVKSAEEARDLAVVKSANPLSTVTVEYLREKMESDTLDWSEGWLRLTCNIPRRGQFSGIPEADWDACVCEAEIPEGAGVIVGLDVAWLIDTTAVVPLWVESPERRRFGHPVILTPPRDGTMLDSEKVKQALRDVHERNPIIAVVLDRHRAEDTAAWVESDLGVEVYDRTQGNADAAEDCSNFLEALREGWIEHDGSAEFRRHVLNAIIRRLPGEKERFDRPSTSRNTKAGRQERRVIDALTAAAMANTVAAVAGDSGESYEVYDLDELAGAA